MAGLNIKINAIEDLSTAFENMCSKINNTMNKFESMESTIDSTFKNWCSGAENATNMMNGATETTNDLSRSLEAYEQNVMSASESIETLVSSSDTFEDAMNNSTVASDEAAEKLKEYGEQSETTRKKVKGLGEESENTGRKSKEAIDTLEDALATAGIVAALDKIADGFMQCSDAAANFETYMAKVSTVADTKAVSTDEISNEMTDLSMDVAKSVNALADATYNAISASVDTADAVQFVGTSNKLAVGGFTESATAVDVLTTAINAYGLEASEATQISAYLITTQNLGKTTVDQLASSIGMVIPTAAAFNVELDDLSTGYAILTSNGIQTAQATTYLKSMFSELADSGSSVAEVLKEETGAGFADLMEQGYSLGDVMQILGNSVDGNTTEFMNLWSSMEAGSGAVSIFNSGAEKYTQVLEKMQNSSGATEKAYSQMTSTTEFATERMENSFDNLSIAIGDDLNPAISRMRNGVADSVDWFTKMVQKYPAITSTITGITSAVAVAAGALAAYKGATVLATVATTAWTAVLDMNPVFLATTAVAALTAGIVVFTSTMEDSETEYDTWIESTRQQYDELQNLNSEYDQAVMKYGKTSEEASRLRYQIDDLNQSFQDNKQTVEDFVTECDELLSSHEQLVSQYDDNIDAIHSNELGTMALIQKLDDLSSSTDQTAGSQKEMEAIIEELNKSVDGLSISYNDLITNQDSAVESLKAMAQAQAEQEKYQEQYEKYVEAVKEKASLEEKIAKATDNVTLAQERYNIAYDSYYDMLEQTSKYDMTGLSTAFNSKWSDEAKELHKATDNLEKYKKEQTELQIAYDENIAFQKEVVDGWNAISEATNEASDSMISKEDAITSCLDSVSDKIIELAHEYDNTYQSALESINGQIGLFDSIKTETEQSVKDMQKALDSQVEYLTAYTENLQKASEYGLDDGLISSLSDGSAESAGQLDAIIEKIEKLGGTTEGMSDDAKKFVDSFNSSFEQVQQAKDTFAETVATMETDFSSSMDQIGQDLEEAITEMDMSEESATAAKNTMDAYIDMIKSKTPELKSAMDALKYSNSTLEYVFPDSTSSFAAHAEGGIFDEPHYGVFAEAGPEAFIPIDGSENSRQIWEDTGRMIGTIDDDSDSSLPTLPESNTNVNINNTSSEDKTITLKLEGAGSIKAEKGLSKDSILDFLIGNVRDVLLDILKQEMTEEGDETYEF